MAKLKDYATSKKDMKRGDEIVPEENYRLKSEDIYVDAPKKTGKESSPGIQSTKSSIASTESSLLESSENLPDIGRETSTTVYAKAGDKKVTLADFEIKKVIGRGSFGKVFLVQKKGS